MLRDYAAAALPGLILEYCTGAAELCDISRFFPRSDKIFSWEALDPFLGAQDEGFRNFVLHKCILVFDSEQVYSKLQATNLKNKEVTLNPKPQALQTKIGFSKTLYPKPYTLNQKHQICPKP